MNPMTEGEPLAGPRTDTHTTIDGLAEASSLLVCIDFDGTICELSPDAYAVTPHPEAIEALDTLARLPGTTVAVLSGRHLAGLRRVCPLGPPVVLVGSHGAEPPAEPDAGREELKPADQAYLADISAKLDQLVMGNAPAFVEAKPYQRVLHVAQLAEHQPERAARLLEAAQSIDTGGRPITPGHNVVEFSAVETTKGTWLAAQRPQYEAVVFAGDDVTDETALRVLATGPAGDGDVAVGIKVSADPQVDTAAAFRISNVDEMADYLIALAAARRCAQHSTG